MNNDHDFDFEYDIIQDKPVHFSIQQDTKANGTMIYEIKRNGKSMKSIENTEPKSLKDLTLFLSDNHYDSFERFGELRELRFMKHKMSKLLYSGVSNKRGLHIYLFGEKFCLKNTIFVDIMAQSFKISLIVVHFLE